jgi:hypothetical protein
MQERRYFEGEDITMDINIYEKFYSHLSYMASEKISRNILEYLLLYGKVENI